MNAVLLIVELVVLSVLQIAWGVYYGLRYRWRQTPLGPVWLAKGGVLAMLWPLLVVNEFARVPTWVWSWVIGPLLILATGRWLWVTVRVRQRPRP